MIAVIDYGMANLRSVERALRAAGGAPCITSDPDVVAEAEKVVLPGVGAFCAAMHNLHQSGLENAVKGAILSGKPFLGICLGLQMLFETSSEMGDAKGLGIFEGRIERFFEHEPAPPGIKVPHIGWNALHQTRASRLFRGIPQETQVYFVHSYFPVPANSGLTTGAASHGQTFCCAVEKDNVAATQFHPEKSGAAGIAILRNFVEWSI